MCYQIKVVVNDLILLALVGWFISFSSILVAPQICVCVCKQKAPLFYQHYRCYYLHCASFMVAL